MEILDNPLTELLLQSGDASMLQLDADQRLLRIVNAAQLGQWLAAGSAPPEPGTPLAQVLSLLFDEPTTTRLLHELAPPSQDAADAPLRLCRVPGRLQRLAPPRWFDLTRALLADSDRPLVVVIIADRTLQKTLEDSATQARAAQEAAVAVLRADAARLRQFLQNANSALGFIRATLRQPARTHQALRDKLRQLHTEVASIAPEASQLALSPVTVPAHDLLAALEELLALDAATGDDLLPLARRIDALSAGIAQITTFDEQRASPVRPASPARAAPAWHETSEQRVSELIQRLGNEYGVLARLRMKGGALVPDRFHRQIDAALEPLVDNAIRHGIEPPDERLAAGKRAAGTITITFTPRDAGGLEMSVHDDGRGFDLARIRADAIEHGILSVEDDSPIEPRTLVGLVFNAGFSGAGRSMALLRESLQRQGGNVFVATKSQRYTQFTIRFAGTSAARAAARRTAAP